MALPSVLLLSCRIGYRSGILPDAVKKRMEPPFADNPESNCYRWDYPLFIYLADKNQNALGPGF